MKIKSKYAVQEKFSVKSVTVIDVENIKNTFILKVGTSGNEQ